MVFAVATVSASSRRRLLPGGRIGHVQCAASRRASTGPRAVPGSQHGSIYRQQGLYPTALIVRDSAIMKTSPI
jgi:hypothetical protein